MSHYPFLRRTLYTVGALVLLLGSTMVSNATTNGYSSETAVFVAEDLTTESGCLRVVDQGGEKPCPLGSMIYVRETTMREVQKKNMKVYARKTGDVRKDKDIKINLATSLSRQTSQRITPLASCTIGSRDIYQSYLYIPSDPNSTRIRFNLKYNRSSLCGITGVKDRDQIQATGTSGNPWANNLGVLWAVSCTNSSSSQCNTLNAWVNTSWTGLYNQQSSMVGNQYVNIVMPEPGCKLADGYTDCASPYGFYWFD